MVNEILVGLDDSPSSRAALRWAAQYAQQTGMTLRAVHALSWPFGVQTKLEAEPTPGWSIDEMDEIYRASITAVFDEIDPRPDWILQFAEGDAGPVLVRQSGHADLLVIGTPDHVGLGRVLTGSVGHYCLSRAGCPVVAVPAGYVGDVPRAPAPPTVVASGPQP